MSLNGNNQAPSAANQQCLGGCGFFGSQSSQGYCSVCFKKNFGGTATPSFTAQPAVAGPPALPSNAMGGSAASETAASNSPASAADLGPRIAGSAAASSSADNDVVMNDASSNSSSAVAASSSSSMIVQPSSGNADILGAKLPATTASSGGTGEVPAAAAADPTVQTNKGRCWNCRKKVGLTGFECRCGYVFCSAHRHADTHTCTFDYKTHDRGILEKNLVKATAAKVDKL